MDAKKLKEMLVSMSVAERAILAEGDVSVGIQEYVLGRLSVIEFIITLLT